MIDQLYQYFNRYVPFSHQEIDVLCSCLEQKTYTRKAFLLKEGDICKDKYFITEGLVRTFRIDNKGIEHILLFGIENWWVTNTESFTRVQPSHLYIQAVENTTVLALSKRKLEQLYAQIPQLERAFRMITENMLVAALRHLEFRQQMNNEEMYRHIVQELPGFVQRVPQYMLASYLGMTPEHLSALRKNK
ncbi:MAG TPA: Crp/Fnr family transcriptional regulator [Microscillaceae bacterium]|nr:Crp/Fnr family transcriptional regulator [Microscillaceae bacterium]